MIWCINFDALNRIWVWSHDLPNGWTAQVSDDSQFGYPKKPTHYFGVGNLQNSDSTGKAIPGIAGHRKE